MLRLIGAVVIVLLLLGPLLERAGVIPPGGLTAQFINLETTAFVDFVAWVRALLHAPR